MSIYNKVYLVKCDKTRRRKEKQ